MPIQEIETTELEAGTQVASSAGAVDIITSVRIEAEVQRILYALATPEYMEAWLQFPEAERVECQSEQRSFDRFRIDLFSSQKRKQSIYGSCFLSKPNRVTYLWDTRQMGPQSRSVVELFIIGGPSRFKVKLKHCGLATADDREWHSAMWHHSLIKLRTLMERVDVRPAGC
jgi:hypothetical protein